MNPIVVTFANETTPGHETLIRSLKQYGWPHEIIRDQWRGFGHRLKRVLARAQAHRDVGFTHIVHVDAFDVVCQMPHSAFTHAMLGHEQTPLLIALEGACWPPDPGRAEQYGPKLSNWWYAHSQWVLNLNQPVPEGFGELADGDDDQRHLHELVLKPTHGIERDFGCKITQSLAHSSPRDTYFAIQDGKVVNRQTSSTPIFLHGNGRTDMSWLPEVPQQ